MPLYVKKPIPVRIEAMSDRDTAAVLMAEINDTPAYTNNFPNNAFAWVSDTAAVIPTLEGQHWGEIGSGPTCHSVVFGNNGDPYFIRNDVLAETYEAVES
ncbi:MAG: hypothetical protein AAGA99_17620 [Actinomycetota bacterium]